MTTTTPCSRSSSRAVSARPTSSEPTARSNNLEIVSILLELMGQPADWFDHVNDRPGHDLRYAIDSTKLRAETDWRPRYSDVRAGLDATIEWYQRQRGLVASAEGRGRAHLRPAGPMSRLTAGRGPAGAVEPLRVLVTGAGGMLGHDLVPATAGGGPTRSTALGRADLDVTDASECLAGVAGHDLVVNAAAHTAVDAAETDEAAAFAVNAVGAANLARACARAGSRLVQISTDYVFDGTATEPYAVDHPIAPRSAYGRTKAAGEWAVQALCAPSRGSCARRGSTAPSGPNFVSTMLRLAGERDTARGRRRPGRPADVDVGPGRPLCGSSPGRRLRDPPRHLVGRDDVVRPRAGRLRADRARPRAGAADDDRRLPAAGPATGIQRPVARLARARPGVSPIGDWRDGLAAHLAKR